MCGNLAARAVLAALGAVLVVVCAVSGVQVAVSVGYHSVRPSPWRIGKYGTSEDDEWGELGHGEKRVEKNSKRGFQVVSTIVRSCEVPKTGGEKSSCSQRGAHLDLCMCCCCSGMRKLRRSRSGALLCGAKAPLLAVPLRA